MSADKSGLAFPFHALMMKLSGVEVTKKPRTPAAWTVFQQASYNTIIELKVEAAMAGKRPNERGGILMKITMQEFKMLPHPEQVWWSNEAKRVGEALKRQWVDATQKSPSLSPVEVQMLVLIMYLPMEIVLFHFMLTLAALIT